MRARVAPLVLAAATVLSLAGGACSSGDPDSTDPLPTPVAPPTTTTATPEPTDPFAIPEVIDEAYVNRVLAALDQIDGDILRRVVVTGGIDGEVPKLLRAIYNDPQFDIELQSLRGLLSRGLDNFKSPPGNRKTFVSKLVSVRDNCILLEATTEYSEVLKEEPPDVRDEVELFTLSPTPEGADLGGFNPTRWSIVNAEVVKRDERPKARATCNG